MTKVDDQFQPKGVQPRDIGLAGVGKVGAAEQAAASNPSAIDGVTPPEISEVAYPLEREWATQVLSHG